jgi:hypothetical protein
MKPTQAVHIGLREPNSRLLLYSVVKVLPDFLGLYDLSLPYFFILVKHPNRQVVNQYRFSSLSPSTTCRKLMLYRF